MFKRTISALLVGLLLSTNAYATSWFNPGPYNSFNTIPWFGNGPQGPFETSPTTPGNPGDTGGFTLGAPGGGGTSFVAGFLSNAACTGQFSPTNYVAHSNDFIPADGFWTAENNGASLPTATSVSDTLPDGTTGTVSKVVFGATPAGSTVANGDYSVIHYSPSTTLVGSFATAFQVYAKVVAGGSQTPTLWTSISRATTFFDAPIPNDGAWHLVTATTPGNPFGFNVEDLQIGISQGDVNQRLATASITVELSGASFSTAEYAPAIPYSAVKTGGALATTGSAGLVGTFSSPCPTHVAFRDPTLWTNYSGNPFVTANPAEAWDSTIATNPAIQSQFQSGGFYWGWASECTGSNASAFIAMCLFKSTDALHWTEDTTNAPYLLAPGANISTETVGTSAAPAPAKWELHAQFLPFGCNDGTTAHAFCIIYSAEDVNNAGHLYMAWSNTVNGVYTTLGSAPVAELQLPPSGYSNQGVPAVLNVGGATGLNYIYAYSGGGAGDSGANYVIFSTPANSATTTSGNTLTFVNDAGFTLATGHDWYAPVTGTKLLDLGVFVDHCGIIELYFTVENTAVPNPPWFAGAPTTTQLVGEAVSNAPGGPFYQYPGSIVPGTSPAFAVSGIGDPTPIEINGQFIMTLAYNAPGGAGAGFALLGPQGTCP